MLLKFTAHPSFSLNACGFKFFIRLALRLSRCNSYRTGIPSASRCPLFSVLSHLTLLLPLARYQLHPREAIDDKEVPKPSEP
jgi:hypothetical protein